MDDRIASGILQALRRIADADEERNRLLKEESRWRRESFERDQAANADRFAAWSRTFDEGAEVRPSSGP